MARTKKSAKKDPDVRAFSMRLPTENWMFLKKAAIDQGISMTDLITHCVQKYQKRIEDRLTAKDTLV